jgi:CysZ protein
MGFLRGIAAFFAGVGWVASTPRLWARALVPVATALVLVVALSALGIYGALALAHRELGGGIGAGLASAVLAVGAVIVAVLVGVSLAQPLSGWALDGIVRAQERDLGLPPAAAPSETLLGSLGSALLALAAGVPLLVLLTLVGWIFPPLALVTVPFKVLVAALWLAWDLLDYPLTLRGMGVRARVRWCASNFGAVLGFGLAAALLFAVPGFGLLALPCGVAGAARLATKAGQT